MSAETSHEWLIDGLYKEHDEQPDNPESTDVSMSEESERSELVASYDAMLTEIREGLVMHTPRGEVSDSIRAAARKQAEVFAAERTESGARPGRRRAPSGADTSTQSFWSRAKRQGVLQLVAVLAVCLGAGLLVRMMAFAPAEESRFESASAPNAEVAFFDAEEKASVVDALGAPEKPVSSTQVANNDFKDYDYAQRSDETNKPLDSKDIAVALREESKEAQNEIEKLSKRKVTKKSRPKKSGRGNASVESERSLDNELWGVSKAKQKAAPPKSNKRRDYANDESLSLFGGAEDIAQEKKMASAPSVSGKVDSVGNFMNPAPSSAASEPTPAADVAPTEAADKEVRSSPSITEEQATPITTVIEGSAQQPSATTLADAERAYKKNDYEQTLTDSDAYLDRGIGTNTQRARAMELKAQALNKLGRSGEAQAIYEDIREQYPDYYRKENIRQKKKSRKAAPKKKMEVDFSGEDDLMQSY